MIEFVKYRNRKIYNPETHGYASLEQLLPILSGGEGRVICNETKTNLTEEVLFEALLSKVKKKGLYTKANSVILSELFSNQEGNR